MLLNGILTMKYRTINKNSQQGAVLLLLMFAIIIGMASFFLVAYNNNKLSIQNDKETSETLGLAKQAILDYVTANYHLYQTGDYGFLPCPDTSAGASLSDGDEHKYCLNSHINSIGHLPWRTLGLSPLKDSSGECLWYVVTGLKKQDDINDTESGLIRLYSGDRITEISDPSDPFVAAIIAPKTSLAYQARALNNQNVICEQSFDATDYLDQTMLAASGQLINNSALNGTIDTPDVFISAQKSSINSLPPYSATNPQPFNDQIIYITRNELLAAIQDAGDTAETGPSEAELDVSTAQISFANNLDQFNIKRENATYTTTGSGEDSELILHTDISTTQAQQHICLWYDDTFELENRKLRTFFKFKLQEDTSPDSMGRCSGFTFAITPGPSTTCGNDGGNLGFTGMPGPLGNRSFAVEYDIAPTNSKNDPVENHIAVVTNSHNSHNTGGNASCPSTGCASIGSTTQEEITWTENLAEHSTRIEIQTGFTTDECLDGDAGNGGDYAKVITWVNCTGSSCTDMGKLDADYNEGTNLPMLSHCIDYPRQMEGNPDDGENGIRFGFTAAIGGCNAGPVPTDITLSEFGLTFE